MAEHKIWIVYSNTGGGHRSAARALEAAISEVASSRGDANVLVTLEPLAEGSHPVNRFFVWLYNYLLQKKQSWMKYYFAFINATKPNDSELGYSLIKPFLAQLVTRDVPSVIVSVHPMLNHYLARNRHDLGLTDKVKLIEVITDPNRQLWGGWACKDMDAVIAPNDLARGKLIELGVPAEKIRILGMPINTQFLKPSTKTRTEFLEALGLDPALLTVCVNSGWAGGGNMRKVYSKLSLVKRPFQVLFLCGHNNALYEAVKEDAASSPVKTAVLPFHDCMVDVMSHCDLMVTKGGGLTTFEAIAKRLPLVFDALTEPMPQEKGTIEMLVNMGFSHELKQPEDIVPIVESARLIPNKEQQPLPATHNLNLTGASYEIAKLVLASCEPSFNFAVDAAPAHSTEQVFEPVWEGAQLGLEGT
jgi:UDP-N-acetylglucosamine:LPS N-acetylglucosamine transferase